MNNIKWIFCCAVICPFYAWEQTTTAKLPQKEPRPYFKFETFPRGFDESTIHQSLAYLQAKPNEHWDEVDSLQFMNDLIYSNNLDLAYQYLIRIKTDTIKSRQMIHAIQYMLLSKGKYTRLRHWYDKELQYYPGQTKQIQIRRRVARVHQLIAQKDWYYNDSIVFAELLEEGWKLLKKGSPEYKLNLISLLKKYDEALRVEVQFNNAENKALALAFQELGHFIEAYVDYTDAFIAYNCARFYSRKSMRIAKDLKEAKQLIQKHDFLLPSFRKVFPKKPRGIFNYALLKEKIRLAEADSMKNFRKQPIAITKSTKSTGVFTDKSANLILLMGLFAVLLSVIFFVKTKSKRKE